MIQRGRSIGSTFASKWAILIVIIFSVSSFPRKAEASPAGDQASKATVLARAEIQKRIEVRPENFSKARHSDDLRLPDISFHDCDFEVRRVIKNCVLMIYESQ